MLSGKTHEEIARIHGSNSGSWFGYTVENLGDLDKDGVADIGVGSPKAIRVGNQDGPGIVYVYSGKTRKLIYTIRPGTANYHVAFGFSMAALGDVNADGYPDFVVGAPANNKPGYAYLYSGKDGAVIRKLTPPDSPGGFGGSVVALGDVDGDKISDIAIQAGTTTVSSNLVYNPIYLFSGKSGASIRQIHPVPIYRHYGMTLLRVCDDVDADKKKDIVISFPYGLTSPTRIGEVQVYSSGTGNLLSYAESPPGAYGQSFGESFDCIPDLDGDGSPEILIGDETRQVGRLCRGAVHRYSAKTGKLVETYSSRLQDLPGTGLGWTVAALGDLNRDGIPDFYTSYRNSSLSRWGMCILSARPLDLSSDKTSLSLFQGGKMVLSVHAGKAHAGDLCMVLGSASGTNPGMLIGGKRLWLNLDAYLSFTLAAPHAVFYNNLSVLDANGEGKVGFTLPLGLSPSLGGTLLHHSCLFLGKSGLDFANLAVPLALTKF